MFFGLREGVMHDMDPCCWSLIQRPCRIEDGGRYQKVTRDGGGGWNQKKDYETGKAKDGGHVVVVAVPCVHRLYLSPYRVPGILESPALGFLDYPYL